jgi:hemoglobin-like flavoprotein
MTPPVQLFTDLKQFIGFTDADAANLRRLAPLFAEHGAAVTDAFYERLAGQPETAALIAGRVDKLKQTHARWMSELFAGDYGDGYLADRWRVGLTHVRAGIKPHWVDAVASFLRAAGTDLIAREIGDPDERIACTQSYLRILDLDMMLVDLAYGEERLERLSQFTGMSRKLIERCVLQNKA